MRDRHWGTLSQKLGMTVRLTTDLTLDSLIKAGFTSKLDILTDIKNVAVKEYALEKQLEIILNEWDHLELEFATYRNTQVLKGTDKLTDTIEDQTIKLQAMKGYIFAFVF